MNLDTWIKRCYNFRKTPLSNERKSEMEVITAAPKIVGPEDAQDGFLGSIGVRWMIDGDEADQRFSLVEHAMSPRALAAPLHLHTREDEYSYVLEGRMGALLGDDVVEAGPGDLVHKPRNQWHTFWNAGDEPTRILEIISPAGFEVFFRELDAMGGAINADPEALAALNEKYGQQMQPDSVPDLLERFGLVIGEHLTGGWTP
jgi:mannose-6-phosphate isomerase-like protein (cupin superfamily)